MLTCDWCDELIDREGVGYKIVARPFSVLDLDRVPDNASSVASGIHLHAEPCRERFMQAAIDLAGEHVPLESESVDNHGYKGDDDGPTQPERQKEPFEPWDALPKHEQDRRVLEVFDGNDKLLNPEVIERLEAKDDEVHPNFTEKAGIVTNRLAKAGELVKEEGRWGMCRVRYTRKKPDEGQRELERLLSDGSDT